MNGRWGHSIVGIFNLLKERVKLYRWTDQGQVTDITSLDNIITCSIMSSTVISSNTTHGP